MYISDEEYTITDISLADAGTYVCTATNEGGTEQKTYHVQVKCKITSTVSVYVPSNCDDIVIVCYKLSNTWVQLKFVSQESTTLFRQKSRVTYQHL